MDGFMEILTEDINYILVIDWKKPKENTQKYKGKQKIKR